MRATRPGTTRIAESFIVGYSLHAPPIDATLLKESRQLLTPWQTTST